MIPGKRAQKSRLDAFDATFRSLTAGVSNFATDMRKQGIHLGMGTPPSCVTCDEAWPCGYESQQRAILNSAAEDER